MVVSPPHSFPSFQGPTICLARRRGREDCPHLAALTTTPGTDFDARRHLSPRRPSGPKPLTPRGAAQPTAMRGRGRGRENGKEREKERSETRPLAKKRKTKTGERLIKGFKQKMCNSYKAAIKVYVFITGILWIATATPTVPLQPLHRSATKSAAWFVQIARIPTNRVDTTVAAWIGSARQRKSCWNATGSPRWRTWKWKRAAHPARNCSRGDPLKTPSNLLSGLLLHTPRPWSMSREWRWRVGPHLRSRTARGKSRHLPSSSTRWKMTWKSKRRGRRSRRSWW